MKKVKWYQKMVLRLFKYVWRPILSSKERYEGNYLQVIENFLRSCSLQKMLNSPHVKGKDYFKLSEKMTDFGKS
jgi:hypothetical protein